VTASEQHSRRHGTLMAQQRCLLCCLLYCLGGQQLLLPEAAMSHGPSQSSVVNK